MTLFCVLFFKDLRHLQHLAQTFTISFLNRSWPIRRCRTAVQFRLCVEPDDLSALAAWQPNPGSPLGEAGAAPIAECAEPDARVAEAALDKRQPASRRRD